MSEDREESAKPSRREFLQASAAIAGTAVLGGATVVESRAEGGAGQADDSTSKYQSLVVEKKNQVATVRLYSAISKSSFPRGEAGGSKPNDAHVEYGELFTELRADNSIRVIVLTGAEDGIFMSPPPQPPASGLKGLGNPAIGWNTGLGVTRYHEAMAAIEKPIVARVNGHAIGTGQCLMFASDIIVAREDAIIVDHHLGGSVTLPGYPTVGMPNNGIVPGDGGLVWVPQYMSPAKAKEYLMLSKQYTAKELAAMNVINYAVPAAQLDQVVDDIVKRLLERPAYALAWTKRVMNRYAQEQLIRTMDSGHAYETINFLQLKDADFKDRFTLD